MLLLAACSPSKDSKHYPHGERSFRLGAFHRIFVRGVDNVTVRFGPTFSAHVAGPTNILDELVIAREGDIPGMVNGAKADFASKEDIAAMNDVLSIDRDFKSVSEWNTPNPVRVNIVITMPRIHSMNTLSSGTVSIDGLSGEHFKAAVSGGYLLLQNAHVNKINIFIGAGSLVASGKVNVLDILINGSAPDVNLRRLVVNRAVVQTDGFSHKLYADVRGPVTVSGWGSDDLHFGKGALCTVIKPQLPADDGSAFSRHDRKIMTPDSCFPN
ncbi:MAG: DUF2807 domain-containing protein [Sphingomonas bacterium]